MASHRPRSMGLYQDTMRRARELDPEAVRNFNLWLADNHPGWHPRARREVRHAIAIGHQFDRR